MRLKKFNENWIRRKLNRDEEIAENIYAELLTSDIIESDIVDTHFNYSNTMPSYIDRLIKSRETSHFNGSPYMDTLEVDIRKLDDVSGFRLESVRLKFKYSPRGGDCFEYYVLIDGVKLKSSISISRKIYKELELLKEGKRREEYTLKDAKDKFKDKK